MNFKYASFKQTNIRYSDQGKGRCIVFIHGFLEDLEIWNEFSSTLSKNFRVIAIDLPGSGETPGIGYIHTMEMMADSVKAVLDKEKLRKYVLVGHSMGGYVALAFTEKYPKNVTGLCLFHSTAIADSPEKKVDRSRAIEIVKRNPNPFIKNFFANLFAPENVSRLAKEMELLEKKAITISGQNIVNALEGMKQRPDRQQLLKKANFPILFIAGVKDKVIPYESIVKQSEGIKNARVISLENAGHLGFIEAKEETLGAIKKFVRQCYLPKPGQKSQV